MGVKSKYFYLSDMHIGHTKVKMENASARLWVQQVWFTDIESQTSA